MRRLPLCFFLIAFSAPFAFADGTTSTISRVIPSTSGTSSSQSDTAARGSSATVSRAQVSRTTTNTASQIAAGVTKDVNEREEADRNVVSRTATNTDSADSGVVRVGARVVSLGTDNAATKTASTARSSTTTINSASTSRSSISQTGTSSARETLEATVNNVGLNPRVEAASINSNPALRRAGVTLRPTTAEVGGRAKIAGTTVQTGSNIDEEIRNLQSRAASSTQVATSESISEAKERLELTSDLNSSCQQQYNDCMDQFCAVVNSNQGRCSCSSNLSNYTEVEEAVTDANNQLNEVAQRIRYVGLSADEIRAIMTETEAEEALNGSKDTSETRNMLEEIEALIRDPVSTTSSYTSSSFGLDMDLDFSSDVADIFSLDFLNTGTTSFSNLRGKDLYNAAKSRCKTVLNQCEAAGANVDQITGNYDLAIDKDCIAYEQGLTKMNETLVSNVRSANLMLQKARLAVLQNKNQYDAKGCIAALDACMTDEMVCGADYTKCLDPTKRYIDENGDVVLGENITNITAFMKNYDNSKITDAFLSQAYKMSTSVDSCTKEPDKDGVGNNGACIVKYLLQKIGTGQEVTDEGLCRAVLDKCQAYTYDDNEKYNAYNDIVVNYVQRAMVNIQAEQRQIISDYASNCMLDIANCYNQQVTQVNAWSSSASVSSIYSVMRGACRNVALTCAYAVFAEPEDSTNASTACIYYTDTSKTTVEQNESNCIDNISQMFYQSLLCPDNSTYQKTDGEAGSNDYVNDRCKCNNGYEPFGSQCLRKCDTNFVRNSYGTCVCDSSSGYTMVDGSCVKSTNSD